ADDRPIDEVLGPAVVPPRYLLRRPPPLRPGPYHPGGARVSPRTVRGLAGGSPPAPADAGVSPPEEAAKGPRLCTLCLLGPRWAAHQRVLAGRLGRSRAPSPPLPSARERHR